MPGFKVTHVYLCTEFTISHILFSTKQVKKKYFKEQLCFSSKTEQKEKTEQKMQRCFHILPVYPTQGQPFLFSTSSPKWYICYIYKPTMMYCCCPKSMVTVRVHSWLMSYIFPHQTVLNVNFDFTIEIYLGLCSHVQMFPT